MSEPLTAEVLTALNDVLAERRRQHEKWGEQNLPDGYSSFSDRVRAAQARDACNRAASEHTVTWRHVLMEEVAETLAESDPDLLRAELVQVAAVALQWIEAIDRRQSQ